MHRPLVCLLAAPLFLAAAARAEPPLLEVAHQGAVWAVALSPDGKVLASAGQDGAVRLVNVASGKEVCTIRASGPVKGIAFAPDGKTLVLKPVGGALALHDTATGRQTKTIGGGLLSFLGHHLAFSADGTSVTAVGVGERLIWHHTRGGASGSRMGNPPGDGFAAVSPDGKTTAWGYANGQIQLSDATGLGYRQLRVGPARALALSPDGKTAVSGNTDKIIRLWEIGTGREVRRFEGLPETAVRLAFSADGKVLAAIASGGRAVRLWDVERGRARRQLTGLRAPVTDLALTPDGKVLATAGDDGRARLWSVATRDLVRPSKPAVLSARELEKFWDDLAAADHARADAAFRRLAGAGDGAVPFLRERLRRVAVPKVDPERVAKLVRDLDARSYGLRRQASAELAQYGEVVEVPLRKLLAARPSAEAARRAHQLLEKLKEPALAPDGVRCLEALELLEGLGSTESRRALEEIARDGLIRRLRTEAVEALQRLTRQGEKGRG